MNASRVHFGMRSMAIAAAAAGFFIALLWHLSADVGVRIPAAPTASAGLTGGAWLTDLVARPITALPWPWPIETVLAVVAACALGLLIAWLYERLVYNDWTRIEALFFVVFLTGSAAIIASVTGDHRAIATMVACIAVVPGIRRIESVGDVQANMSFGLVLPLLFLAGPPLAPLILPLALFGALADPVARHDWRAFVAMFLVAIMPTLLVFTGMIGLFGISEVMHLVTDVYVPAYSFARLDHAATQALLTQFVYTVLPFATVTVAYIFMRDRRWQPVSAIAVMVLPLYLVGGAIVFSWPMSPSLPTVAFLGAYASWLSVARLRPVSRWVSIALMLLTAALSWSLPVMAIAN
jgi:hypothetical protein